jgi:transposase
MGRNVFRRRRYTPAFKVEAVRVMRARLDAGLTLQRVSEELDVDPDMLRGWAKQIETAPAGAVPEAIFPGHGRRRLAPAPATAPAPAESLEAEVGRLRRENERLRMERDFLKKAAAFFATESR